MPDGRKAAILVSRKECLPVARKWPTFPMEDVYSGPPSLAARGALLSRTKERGLRHD